MLALLLLAAVAGALLPVQAGVNAQLRLPLAIRWPATLVSFVVGTVALGLVVLGARIPLPAGPRAGARCPGGTGPAASLGAVYVALIIVLAPRLGAATLIAAVVAGQMAGVAGARPLGAGRVPPHPLSPQRALGALLVIGGVALVRG